MKNVYIIILAFLFSLPALAQESDEKDGPREVSVLCKMPGKKKGQWLTLKPATPSEIGDLQDKLIYLQVLNEEEVTKKGVLGKATSDAILKFERSRGVTYNTKELVGLTQGMKNRLIVAYYTATRAAEEKQ